MANISTAFRKKLERDPKAMMSVIVRVRGDDATPHTQKFGLLGLTIKHAYTLIPGFALTGPASAILALTNEAWIISIEEDKQVHTM